MASSGSFNTSAYTGASGTRYLTFSWEETSQNVTANTTTISWKLIGGGTSTQYFFTRNIKLTIDGETVFTFAGSSDSYKKVDQGTVVASGTYTFVHKTDGSRAFTAYAEAGIYVWDVNCTGSKTFTLDTIPRATTPTVSSSSVNMGSAVTINTPRASSSFTHDLAYSFAGGSYVSIATGVGTSYKWTTPDLASKIPSTTSGTLTIRCITKNGGTEIGTKTITMTLKVPTNVVPTISAVTVEEATSGLAARFGAFIKSKSKIKATVAATGAKGSTIKSYSTVFNGKTYPGASWTSSVINASGTLNLVTTVTDTRGRTAKKTTTITVLDYSGPVISSFSVYRCNAAGEAVDDGIYIALRYKYSVPSLNGGNTASMVIAYRLSADSEYTTILTGSELSADTEVKPTSPTFSADSSYTIKITVKDYFGCEISTPATLSTASVILDIGADGTCLGIGKVAELSGVFDTAMQTKFTGGLLHPTLEPGTDLNDVRTPNTYVGANVSTHNYGHCPLTSGTFTLEVVGMGDAGQVKQRLIYCHKTESRTLERIYYSSAWGEWICVSDYIGKLLWSGGRYMSADHDITLPEPVSKQRSGLLLVFSGYSGGSLDDNIDCKFVPKYAVKTLPGAGYDFVFSTADFSFVGAKKLYISDGLIDGHDSNITYGTKNGVTFDNRHWVLRYVIGV